MIHLFPTFSNDASKSPLALELAALGEPYRLFPEKISLRYRSRLALVFLGWPRVFWFGLKSAYKSMIASPDKPDVVLLGSDVEVLVFGLLRALLFDKRTKICLQGFIYTDRKNRWLAALRQLYFRQVFRFADLATCHSRLEQQNYSRRFANCRTQFAFIPYGMHVAGREWAGSTPVEPLYVLSAGRSGRDYRSLVEAVRGQDIRLRIVCDSAQALAGLDVPDNVTLLRGCYDGDYIREVAGASLVAIPLAVDDISAGQMVMLQAMAFGKPVVVSRTPTICDYVQNGDSAVLVEPGSAEELRATLLRLLADPTGTAALGERGLQTFENRFSMRGFVGNTVAMLRERGYLPRRM